jgi:ribose transport system substrate-binding protein
MVRSAPAPTLAVFTKNRSNPAYHGARLGADRVAARFGARTIHYVPEKPDDVDQQAMLVERAILERPDAVVFVPVHETALNPSMLRLNDAGIPVVSMIAPATAGRNVTVVSSDDRALAAAVTRHLAKRLGGTGEVVILEGVPASATTRPRYEGITSALRSYPGMQVVASMRGDYQRDIAREAVAGLLRKGVRFDAVVAANDTMALGALDALRGGSIPPIVGVNAIPEAIAAIKRRELYATVDFDAMKMACIATEAALRHLRGEVIRPRITLPAQVVDATNFALWDRPYEERPLPEWAQVMEAQG